jgi:hypothetical protein
MKLIPSSSIFFISFFFSQPVAAYLDPGTGSLILQMLIAGIVGTMFTIKLYWYQFKAFIAKFFGLKKKSEDDDNNSDKK